MQLTPFQTSMCQPVESYVTPLSPIVQLTQDVEAVLAEWTNGRHHFNLQLSWQALPPSPNGD